MKKIAVYLKPSTCYSVFEYAIHLANDLGCLVHIYALDAIHAQIIENQKVKEHNISVFTFPTVEDLNDGINKSIDSLELVITDSPANPTSLMALVNSVSGLRHHEIWFLPNGVNYQKPTDIMYASNFCAGDEDALNRLSRRARLFNAAIQVVHVDTDESYRKKEGLLHLDFGRLAPDLEIQFTTVPSMNLTEGLQFYLNHHPVQLAALYYENRDQLGMSSPSNLKVIRLPDHLPVVLFPEMHSKKVATKAVYF